MLSEDLETIPGLVTEASQTQQIHETVQRIEQGQLIMSSDIKAIEKIQYATEKYIETLSAKVALLEREILKLQNTLVAPQPKSDALCCLSRDVAELKASSKDANNRLRRNDLLFFGIDAINTETWLESEKHILNFCPLCLGLSAKRALSAHIGSGAMCRGRTDE